MTDRECLPLGGRLFSNYARKKGMQRHAYLQHLDQKKRGVSSD